LRLPILCRRSRPLQTPKAFDVVSNRREMNLEFGFGKPDPSHRAKMIAAFPGAENFLDARPDWPQRAVVRFEPFGGQPAMALAHDGALFLKTARNGGKQALIEPDFDKLAAEAHKSGALGRSFVAGKATKAAEARPVFERLSEHHIGKIIPSGKQERLEHRQRR